MIHHHQRATDDVGVVLGGDLVRRRRLFSDVGGFGDAWGFGNLMKLGQQRKDGSWETTRAEWI